MHGYYEQQKTLLAVTICIASALDLRSQQALVSMLPASARDERPDPGLFQLDLRPHRLDAPPLSEVTTDSAKDPAVR
jgi:hypothetical protein